jgi:hypothetical protein
MRVGGSDRWKSNWRVVAPSGSVRIDVGGRNRTAQDVRLAPRTSVVLVAPGRRGGARLRAFAREASIDLDREYLAFPSADAPAYLVENDPVTARLFVKNVLASPPGAPFVLRTAVSLFRRLATPRTLRALAPGRVAVGRTT